MSEQLYCPNCKTSMEWIPLLEIYGCPTCQLMAKGHVIVSMNTHTPSPSAQKVIDDCHRLAKSALVDEDCGLHGNAFQKIAKLEQILQDQKARSDDNNTGTIKK